jgi:uncharacterized protein
VTPSPGDRIDVRFTKWGGGRHWEFALTALGTDEHGVWGAGSRGTYLWRPDADLASPVDWVTLVPHESAWAASFYDTETHLERVYVDMTTSAQWSGSTVTMVDLDLDVVLEREGRLFVDDEDEFDEHRVQLGYPDHVVALALRTAEEVFAAVQARAEPFGSVGHAWLAEARHRAAAT